MGYVTVPDRAVDDCTVVCALHGEGTTHAEGTVMDEQDPTDTLTVLPADVDLATVRIPAGHVAIRLPGPDGAYLTGPAAALQRWLDTTRDRLMQTRTAPDSTTRPQLQTPTPDVSAPQPAAPTASIVDLVAYLRRALGETTDEVKVARLCYIAQGWSLALGDAHSSSRTSKPPAGARSSTCATRPPQERPRGPQGTRTRSPPTIAPPSTWSCDGTAI